MVSIQSIWKRLFEKGEDISELSVKQGLVTALVFSARDGDGTPTQPFCYIQPLDGQPVVVYAQPTLTKEEFCTVVKHVLENNLREGDEHES